MIVNKTLFAWKIIVEVTHVNVIQGFSLMMVHVKVTSQGLELLLYHYCIYFVVQISTNVTMAIVMKLDTIVAQVMKHVSTLLVVLLANVLRDTN